MIIYSQECRNCGHVDRSNRDGEKFINPPTIVNQAISTSSFILKGKEHFGTDALWVTLPERLKNCQIKELRLIPRNGEVWIEYVHESLTEQSPSCSREVTGVLGIDRGIDSIIERVGSGLLTNPLRIKLWADSSPKVCP